MSLLSSAAISEQFFGFVYNLVGIYSNTNFTEQIGITNTILENIILRHTLTPTIIYNHTYEFAIKIYNFNYLEKVGSVASMLYIVL